MLAPFQIRKFLDLSTGHLPCRTVDTLRDMQGQVAPLG